MSTTSYALRSRPRSPRGRRRRRRPRSPSARAAAGELLVDALSSASRTRTGALAASRSKAAGGVSLAGSRLGRPRGRDERVAQLRRLDRLREVAATRRAALRRGSRSRATEGRDMTSGALRLAERPDRAPPARGRRRRHPRVDDDDVEGVGAARRRQRLDAGLRVDVTHAPAPMLLLDEIARLVALSSTTSTRGRAGDPGAGRRAGSRRRRSGTTRTERAALARTPSLSTPSAPPISSASRG